VTDAALRDKKLFVLDLDGTFYLGDRIIDGSLDFINKVRSSGRSILFFTNNSSKTSEFYRRKLVSMGCEVEAKDILTSGDVTIEYLRREHPGKGVFLLGTQLLRQSFSDSGIRLEDERPEIVVMGFDTGFSYERANRACRFIREGALFIATHPDINCPTEDGFIPDCGAMCAMITASTGVSPKVLGKPHLETLEAIMHLTGFQKSDIVFVGDRLYTDIAIGADNGATSVLVLSGETAVGDLEKSSVKPDYIFDSLFQLAGSI
jgi:HAD superfamily hydrolase (TIGR01457 family)